MASSKSRDGYILYGLFLLLLVTSTLMLWALASSPPLIGAGPVGPPSALSEKLPEGASP
jgi:hypothetical protein